MDIYAQSGHKVVCVNTDEDVAKFGSCTSPDGVLTVGTQYTVDSTEVHSWHTKVYLVEVEGAFNSAHFEDVE